MDGFEPVLIVTNHISNGDKMTLINSVSATGQQKSQNLFKVGIANGQNTKISIYKITSVLMLSDAVSYDFKLLGIKRNIKFKFDDIYSTKNDISQRRLREIVDEERGIDEDEYNVSVINVFRPISVLGWIFWIGIFFLTGMIFNVTKLSKGMGFNMRDLFV